MKFSGKMSLMIILSHKKQGFCLSLGDTIFEKPQAKLNFPAYLRLNKRYIPGYEVWLQGIWRLLCLHNFFRMFISFTSNKFSPSNNDSCAHLQNANRITVRLTISTNAKRNTNIVKKMANKNGQPLIQLITNSRLSEQNRETKKKEKENCDANKINCRPQHWWL